MKSTPETSIDNNHDTNQGITPVIPPEQYAYGVGFVNLNNYPKTVENVTDPDIIEKYRPEIDWCAAVLMKYNGYGIALPQVGVPYNIAVVKFGNMPTVIFNLNYVGDKTKVLRKSKEADYSLNGGRTFFIVNRFSKIKAYYETVKSDKERVLIGQSKVMRVPAKTVTVSLSTVFQNIADHMCDYHQLLFSKLNKYYRLNEKALELFASVKVQP
jgi:peptide deformylase